VTGPVAVFALVLLWAVAIYRTQVLVRGNRRPESWAMWAAVVALAAAATLFQPTVYAFVDRALAIPNLAELAGHAFILITAWQAQAILVFLVYSRPVAWRIVLGWGALLALTVAAMATFFTLAPVDRDVPQKFTAVYADAPWIVPYWAAFLFTVNVIVFDLIRLVLRYARRTNREHLRFGLQLVAVGAAFGSGYWAQWIAYLALRRTGETPPAWLHAFGTVCYMSGIIFSVIGSVYPAIGPRIGMRTPGGWWDDVQRYRQLYPLWRALTDAAPEIVLNRPPGVVIDVRFWLRRRVIEIEDGLLQLDREQAPDAAPGDQPGDPDPVAEAGAIRTALQSRTASAATVVRPRPSADVGTDYAARLAWQLDIARAFSRLPQPAGPAPVTQNRS
jgi:hypothetical protein